MKCVVNCIPLNTHVRLENTQPCLKLGVATQERKKDQRNLLLLGNRLLLDVSARYRAGKESRDNVSARYRAGRAR